MDVISPISRSVSGRAQTVQASSEILSPAEALKAHWPEYLIEAAGLGTFMVSACVFSVILFHPVSPISKAIASEDLRRVFMGLAMGLTSIGIVFSRFGKRSGAHLNPAITLTYRRLGKVTTSDAAFYTLFQFIGGILGVLFAQAVLGRLLAHERVSYATTIPGPRGPWPAFVAEIVISLILMSVVLTVSNNVRLNRWTGIFAGCLVALYISVEAPISGMSMNPARTFGSAAVGQIWNSVWIYFTAPPIGMLLAAELYKRLKGRSAVLCAKFHHQNQQPCIFQCNFHR